MISCGRMKHERRSFWRSEVGRLGERTWGIISLALVFPFDVGRRARQPSCIFALGTPS